MRSSFLLASEDLAPQPLVDPDAGDGDAHEPRRRHHQQKRVHPLGGSMGSRSVGQLSAIPIIQEQGRMRRPRRSRHLQRGRAFARTNAGVPFSWRRPCPGLDASDEVGSPAARARRMRCPSTRRRQRDSTFSRSDHLPQFAGGWIGDGWAFTEGDPHVRQRLPGKVASQRVGGRVPHDAPPVSVAGVEPQRQPVGRVLNDLETVDTR